MDSELTGFGLIKYSENAYYQGSFINDQKYGFGREVDEKGNFYEGYHVNGLKSGVGRFTYFLKISDSFSFKWAY